jgi:hypothetical protein
MDRIVFPGPKKIWTYSSPIFYLSSRMFNLSSIELAMKSLGLASFSSLSSLSLGPLDEEILEEFVVVVSQTSSVQSVFSQSDPLEHVIEVLLSCATISSWPIVAIITVMDNTPTSITNLLDETNLDM